MMNIQKSISIVSTLMLLAVAAQADWDLGDPFKMHNPQLPDPEGWDVSWSADPWLNYGSTLADDFLCTESGNITDVHFWVSWRNDFAGWEYIDNIHLSIHSDAPANTIGVPWSQPKDLLWQRDFAPNQYMYRPDPDFSGPQGWFDPVQGIVEPDNHTQTWQINVMDIVEPFYQVEGTTYWLDIRVDRHPEAPAEIGWKTSRDHWNDDGVHSLFPTSIPEELAWGELRDPTDPQQSLDLAFVIVPEPTVMAMVLLPAAGFIFVRRRFMI